MSRKGKTQQPERARQGSQDELQDEGLGRGTTRQTKRFAGDGFRSGQTKGRKREGVSTVNLNHPLAANFRKQENYEEASIRVHDAGSALFCNAGIR
jgi:hypothetical protein